MQADYTYRSSEATRRGRRRLLILTLCIIALLLLDLVTGSHLRASIRTAVASLWSGTTRIGSTLHLSGVFSTKSGLAHENAALRQRIADAEDRAAAAAALKSENDQLRTLLHLAETTPGKGAPVISSFRTSPYGTFIIGLGSSDGIEKGQLVYSAGGFVVGTITDVENATALVTNVFAADASTDAIIGGAAVPVVGNGGGNATAHVPRGVTIAVGDPVMAPSLHGRPIGVVGKIDADPTSADQTVHIRLPVNLSLLSYVYVARQ